MSSFYQDSASPGHTILVWNPCQHHLLLPPKNVLPNRPTALPQKSFAVLILGHVTVVLSCAGVLIVLEVSELKDSHTGKMRAHTIALTAESVAAELVSGSIALNGAELAGLLREHNTKKRLDHLVHLVALAAEAVALAAEAAAAEAAAAEAV